MSSILLRSISLRSTLLLTCFIGFSGCQIGYLFKSAYSQVDLLNRRVPIEKALKDPRLSEEQKRKLKLAEEARIFAGTSLGLAKTKSYSTFVQLDAPYVTWVVSASEKNELKHYLWRYPFVGSMPYRGYFEPNGAKEQAKEMKEKGYDTYIRGVTAYSTLGWFRDPILSSMLDYKDYDLVNTIIHETTHATVFIKSEADFNERLASFIGMKGTEAFYAAREGTDSATLKRMHADQEDDKLFGEFISKELDSLDKWYAERKGKAIPEDERQARLKSIQERYVSELKPKLNDKDGFKGFEKAEINNARLMTYRLYFEDLSQFEAVFQKLGNSFPKMLEFAKSLEDSKDPVADLAKRAGE
jgi:predicted aminopeptidase